MGPSSVVDTNRHGQTGVRNDKECEPYQRGKKCVWMLQRKHVLVCMPFVEAVRVPFLQISTRTRIKLA